MPTPEERLQELGVSLPAPATPVAAYVPCVRTGDLVYVSGQVPMVDGKPSHLGHLGDDVDLEAGRAAARTCAVNAASELFGDVFGDAGRHARAAVGVPALPLGVPVEVEAIVEVA